MEGGGGGKPLGFLLSLLGVCVRTLASISLDLSFPIREGDLFFSLFGGPHPELFRGYPSRYWGDHRRYLVGPHIGSQLPPGGALGLQL